MIVRSGHPAAILTRARPLAAVAAVLAAGSVALAGGSTRVYVDPASDAVFRPSSADGFPEVPAWAPIDLRRLVMGAWTTPSPISDPYTGSFGPAEYNHLFRIDLELGGVVCPPGPLTGPVTPDPFRFGTRPLFGFVDIDVDHDRDTGGELTPSAANRFLANAARFGSRPPSSIADRAVIQAKDMDGDYLSTPQFERSGADFGLVFCGCFTPTIIFESGNSNGQFEAGETMIVRGRFFQRAGGYRPASQVTGGSALGAYDPFVQLRFQHSVATDITTVSLVYALDMIGAATLAGGAVQAVDTSVANHTSIEEGVQDLIDRSSAAGVFGLPRDLIKDWHDESVSDSLDPHDWRASAIVGTTYVNPCGSTYLWTDIGFETTNADVNGDSLCNSLDSAAISANISLLDGGPDDADGQVNGSVTLGGFPVNFSVFDVNYDGFINAADVGNNTPACAADWDHNGTVDADDLFSFLDAWFSGSADFNQSGSTNPDDLFAFLDAWFMGCM